MSCALSPRRMLGRLEFCLIGWIVSARSRQAYLTYQSQEDGTVYVAVDEGVMVKAGLDVLVSVRHAIGGTDLSQLHAAVKREFLTLDEQEKRVRTSQSPKWKADSLAAFSELQHER